MNVRSKFGVNAETATKYTAFYATTSNASSSLEAAIARGDNPGTEVVSNIQTVLDGGAGKEQLIDSYGRDVLFGGAGDDTIVGGARGDIIFGNGNVGGLRWEATDALIVEGESDSVAGTLVGGAGSDTYQFDANFGVDTIIDSGGLGRIVVAGTALTGGKQVADNVWESDNKAIVYTLQAGNLIIGQRSVAGAANVTGTITVKNWRDKELGLNLLGPAAVPPAPAVAVRYDVGSDAGYTSFTNANTYTSTQNLLVQNAAAAHNAGSASAPDWYSASVYTGSGADTIEGGASSPVSNIRLSSGAGDDRIFAGSNTTVAAAIARGDNANTIAGTASQTVLEGGAGNDQIMGGDARRFSIYGFTIKKIAFSAFKTSARGRFDIKNISSKRAQHTYSECSIETVGVRAQAVNDTVWEPTA